MVFFIRFWLYFHQVPEIPGLGSGLHFGRKKRALAETFYFKMKFFENKRGIQLDVKFSSKTWHIFGGGLDEKVGGEMVHWKKGRQAFRRTVAKTKCWNYRRIKIKRYKAWKTINQNDFFSFCIINLFFWNSPNVASASYTLSLPLLLFFI